MNIIILLTACITPNGMSCTKLQDPLERRLQYEQALTFYLENTSFKIVFVENTDTYIGDKYIQYINEGRLEFITFMGNDFSVKLGKGYGEAVIIKEAFKESTLIQNCDYVIKITGRLVITNIYQLLNEVLEKLETKKIVGATMFPKIGIAYSHFFIAHKSFFNDAFFEYMRKANDSQKIYFEHILYQQIKKWVDQGNFIHFFLRPICVVGCSGSTGEVYPTHSFNEKIKLYLRGYLRNLIFNKTKKFE